MYPVELFIKDGNWWLAFLRTAVTHALSDTWGKFLRVSLLFVVFSFHSKDLVKWRRAWEEGWYPAVLGSCCSTQTAHHSPAPTHPPSFSKHPEGKRGPVRQNSLVQNKQKGKERASRMRGREAWSSVEIKSQPLATWPSAGAEESWGYQRQTSQTIQFTSIY